MKNYPSEAAHWYDLQGNPRHEVMAKNGSPRPSTLADARKNQWVPSVTTILQVINKPGLNIWKLEQMMLAALTLYRRTEESESEFVHRIVADSQDEAKTAATRGKALHKAIRQAIGGADYDPVFDPHIVKVKEVLLQHGIVLKGFSEHAFCCKQYGYGGTVDYYARERGADPILDFKTKKKLEPGKKLAYDEHVMQLAAYCVGVFNRLDHIRALNVFIGVDDLEIRVCEWPEPELCFAFDMFQDAMNLWKKLNRFTR